MREQYYADEYVVYSSLILRGTFYMEMTCLRKRQILLYQKKEPTDSPKKFSQTDMIKMVVMAV